MDRELRSQSASSGCVLSKMVTARIGMSNPVDNPNALTNVVPLTGFGVM